MRGWMCNLFLGRWFFSLHRKCHGLLMIPVDIAQMAEHRTSSSAVKFGPFGCYQFCQMTLYIVTSAAELVQKIFCLEFPWSDEEGEFPEKYLAFCKLYIIKKEGGDACKSHIAPVLTNCCVAQESEVCICCSESSLAVTMELVFKQ